MSRADLWEDTIIIAMRDMQWSNFIESKKAEVLQYAAPDSSRNELPQPYPSGFVKFDGRAESKLSDVAIRDGERFFLFEVKSSLSKVRTEWRQKGEYLPKFLVERLSELVELAVTNELASEMLMLSLRGHFLTYWSADEYQGWLKGAITCSPYILACAAARNSKEIARRRGIRRPVGIQKNVLVALRENKANSPAIPLSDLMREKYCMQFSTSEEPLSLGLDQGEFLKYVAFLCGSGEAKNGFSLPTDKSAEARMHEPVHLVGLSTMGSHLKVMGSTADLAVVLKGKFEPNPRGEMKAKLSSQGSKASVPRG
ncbi:hypothetical protein [Xanthomonas rydalmerensis]|uniref:Uncharacterized protein n=1 Tax=Xanthomonas rydalmerensis TaxID=3046274 RepID=A0ABZ0JJG7_9XANT|nr:hypothetical protein [Xanthomonas sp. DM-2023]WOS39926.1 hypothetical protein QN243_16125 [Xanthomonas sp. DM-2023]WOS44110.1 hypothetical protein QN242_16125 [Xanthomonas sp. DM-2023]WOS48290.1 hypothetical protein QN240_16125 [Xanthomonas sp. DM-2023]WOS52469.1 hypothetical protein QN244_16125 [Xanthomonas sp. DM-2023]WOS56653.1 hypothetical protein QN245_16125 [Xanthomonas sp. DM-2023]